MPGKSGSYKWVLKWVGASIAGPRKAFPRGISYRRYERLGEVCTNLTLNSVSTL